MLILLQISYLTIFLIKAAETCHFYPDIFTFHLNMNHAKRYVFKHLPFIVLLLLATLAVFNTTINDHYEWGPTLFDSAGYSTMMWHGNLRLDLAPVFSFSFYTDHAATINYIPVVLSYLWPLDHISYYAAFYAAIHAGLLVACYITVRPLFPGRFSGVWATFCTAALFFGSTVYLGAWEMRSDHIAPPCMIMAFRAWQLSRYRQALLWFALTCSVREDIGAYLLLPIGLLTGLQYLQLRKEEPALARKRRNYGLALCGFCQQLRSKNLFPRLRPAAGPILRPCASLRPSQPPDTSRPRGIHINGQTRHHPSHGYISLYRNFPARLGTADRSHSLLPLHAGHVFIEKRTCLYVGQL